jgi:hypothetical protein
LPATDATYAATFAASAPASRPAGIAPPPFLIWFATVSAVSGARLSRSGPTFPLVPASLSMWQPPHVETKAVLPAARSAPAPPPVVVAVLPDVVVSAVEV